MLKEKGFILLMLLIFVKAKEIKIVFWTESVQKNINDDISKSINDFKQSQTDLKILDSIIVVNNEDSETLPRALESFCKILTNDGVSLVIDLTYFPWHNGTNLLSSLELPYLKIQRFISPFLQMFGEFMRQKGGNDVVLIFENEQDKNEALFHMVEGFPFRTLLINAIDEKNFVRRLRDLRPTPAYYGIFAKSAAMNSIFEKISKGKLFKRPTEWHFIFLDTRYQSFRYVDQAINATRFLVNSNSVCQAMKMPNSFCLSEFRFQRAVLLDVFRSLSIFIKSNGKALSPIKADCAELDSKVFAVKSKPLTDLIDQLKFSDFLTVTMSDLFEDELEYQPGLSYVVNATISTFAYEESQSVSLANWQAGEIVKINETLTPTKRFFRIGTTEATPWSYYKRDERTKELILDSEGKPIWQGYCIDFVNTLAEKLNFDFELISPRKGKFGERDKKTRQWDGVIGDLVSGETDFAVTALKMYSEREEVVDFIAPYFEQTGISIVMRKPVRQTSLFKFMTVLRLEVWFSIIGALIATAVMIWLLDKYSPYSSRNNPEAYPYPCREFTLRESFWFALTSFTPQGGGEAPKAVSGRILVAAYWLFVVLMLATFTANLAAFLTVERMQTPVQNLEQLARQSRINYTVVHASDTHQYFINMKFAEDTLYRMWKELALNASEDFDKFRIWDYPIKEQYGHILLAINASEPVPNAAAGFAKVNERENADFAFIHDSAEIKYEITRNCNLTEVGEVFAEQPYAIAVQQGSHLTDELSYAILELQKDRYFEELKGKYWNHTMLKECSASEDQEGITLESLGGVFIATLFGLGLAMLTLAIEVFYYKKREKRENYRSNIIKAFGKITKVKPFNEKSKEVGAKSSSAWNTEKSLNVPDATPPPSFESATYFRGRKVPPSITLGGEEFKPRRLDQRGRVADKQQSTGNVYGAFPQRSKNNLPSYME